MDEFILYRWWDPEGRLLYVGKSIRVYKRISEHRRASAFFAEASTMTIERFATPESLSAAEIHAIRTEHPIFNKAHTSANLDNSASRQLTVIDGPVDRTTGYWARIEPEDIWYSDIIRLIDDFGEVFIQGLVDDDYVPESEEERELCPEQGWYVVTADALEYAVTSIDLDTTKVYRWECSNSEDPFRRELIEAFVDMHLERVAS